MLQPESKPKSCIDFPKKLETHISSLEKFKSKFDVISWKLKTIGAFHARCFPVPSNAMVASTTELQHLPTALCSLLQFSKTGTQTVQQVHSCSAHLNFAHKCEIWHLSISALHMLCMLQSNHRLLQEEESMDKPPGFCSCLAKV